MTTQGAPAAKPGFIERITLKVPGALFFKEVNVAGRQLATYLLRGGYTLVMLAVVAMVAAGVIVNDYGDGSSASRIQRLQALAPAVATAVLWVQLIALPLAAVSLTAPLIAEERRSGTLQTLLTTPMKAWQIVLGKVLGPIVQILILTLLGVPMLLAVRVFGGITIEYILAGTALAMSTCILAAVCGLFASISSRRSLAGSGLGIAILLIIDGGIALLAAYLNHELNLGIREWIFAVIFPPMALMILSASVFNAPGMIGGTAEVWIGAAGWNLAWAALLFFATSLRLRSAMLKDAAGGSAVIDQDEDETASKTTAPADAAAAAMPAIAPPTIPNEAVHTAAQTKEKKQKKPRRRRVKVRRYSRTVGDHPLLWRELRQPMLPGKAMTIIGSIVLVACLLLVLNASGFDEVGAYAVLFSIAGVVMMFMAPNIGGPAFNTEISARTFESLLSTPITARQMVFAKFAGAVRRQCILPALMVLLALMSIAFTGEGLIFIFALFVVLIPPALFMTALAIRYSLTKRRPTAAAGIALLIGALIWVVPPFLFGLTAAMIYDFTDEDLLAKALSIYLVLNPAALYGTCLSTLESHSDTVRFFSFDRISMAGFAGICFTCAAVYSLATVLALRSAAAKLAQLSNRVD